MGLTLSVAYSRCNISARQSSINCHYIKAILSIGVCLVKMFVIQKEQALKGKVVIDREVLRHKWCRKR